MKRRLKIIGLLALMNTAILETLNACMCIPDELKTANYEYYDEVFLGELVKMEQVRVIMKHEDGDYEMTGVEHTFKVSKKWKGSNEQIIKIREFNIGCSTGYNYHIGHGKWIIATAFDETLNSHIKKPNQKPFLLSNMCSLNAHFYDNDDLEKAINYLDQIFPKEIQLTKKMDALRVVLLFGIASSLLSLFLYLKLKV